jgi:hypothetical protein
MEHAKVVGSIRKSSTLSHMTGLSGLLPCGGKAACAHRLPGAAEASKPNRPQTTLPAISSLPATYLLSDEGCAKCGSSQRPRGSRASTRAAAPAATPWWRVCWGRRADAGPRDRRRPQVSSLALAPNATRVTHLRPEAPQARSRLVLVWPDGQETSLALRLWPKIWRGGISTRPSSSL